ncbi:hypothetical protein [Zoogloea sp. LCSB751]|uniref:hypothetical protein n=1 Tax=Zoogloea sp. LCSB751 TaxID=1965277 RepID=UPI0009A52DF7|nr:hypothetical protein [Zoogloea sp. LCSB751]
MSALRQCFFRTGWILGLALLCIFAVQQGELKGDGREYLLYAQALSDHASPEIRAQDVAYLNALRASREAAAGAVDFGTLGEGHHFASGAEFDGQGFVRTQGGQVYAWHFWLYSLCVLPFLWLVRSLGGVPETAFVLCNWSFVVLALAYLFRYWRGSGLQKWLLASLFLLGGTSYYIWWVHPEVFTASLILLGLMACSDRRYGFGMGATALAATQNPPVLFLMVCMAGGALLFPSEARERGRLHVISLRQVVCALYVSIPAFALALAPVMFYRLKLGVANPIAAAGWADWSLMSFDRLWSVYFDLNMGMIVALPAVLLVAVLSILLFVGLAVMGARSRLLPGPAVLAVIAGIVASVVMAVPALSTTNWNHGQAAFGRYAYWLAVPIVLGVVVLAGSLPGLLQRWMASFLLLVQLACVGYYGFWGDNWRSSYLAFKPFVTRVLSHYPALYNPLPEIFAERLLQHENALPQIPGGRFAYPDEKQPTKLLVSVQEAEALGGALSASCTQVSIVRLEQGWAYVNVPMSCYRKP